MSGDDEMSNPVAYIDKDGEICTVAESQRELQSGNHMKLRALFTTTTPSELVKAAEEAIELLICVWQGEKGCDWQESELQEKAYKLRAALEKL